MSRIIDEKQRELLETLTRLREGYRGLQNTGSEGWDPTGDPTQRVFYEGLAQAERALTGCAPVGFHGCPLCPLDRQPDNVYTAGKHERGACHTHETTWLIGSNLTSQWRNELDAAGGDWDGMLEKQRERYAEIEGYRDVDEPIRDDDGHWPFGTETRKESHAVRAGAVTDAEAEIVVDFDGIAAEGYNGTDEIPF